MPLNIQGFRYLCEAERVDYARVGDFKDLLRHYVGTQRDQAADMSKSLLGVFEVCAINTPHPEAYHMLLSSPRLPDLKIAGSSPVGY